MRKALNAFVSSWFTPAQDPTLLLMQQLATIQAQQTAAHAKQQELFQEWLGLFKQAPGDPPEGLSQSDEDIREMLELSAELGNPESADILADEQRLRAYIRYSRAAQ